MKSLMIMLVSLFAVSNSAIATSSSAPTTIEINLADRIVHERVVEVQEQVADFVGGEEEVNKIFVALSSAWEDHFKENPNFDLESLLYASLLAAENEGSDVINSFKKAEARWAEKERLVPQLVSTLLYDTYAKAEERRVEIEAHFGEEVRQILLSKVL